MQFRAHMPMKSWPKARRLVFIIAGPLLAGSIFLYCVFSGSTAVVTDPKRYAAIITELHLPAGVHFPDRIPLSSTAAQFYYRPAFLQGSVFLRLRLVLPISEIEALTRQLLARQAALNSEELLSFGVESGGDRFGMHEAKTIPADFATFCFRTKPTADDNDVETWGISVSLSRGEVVYWIN